MSLVGLLGLSLHGSKSYLFIIINEHCHLNRLVSKFQLVIKSFICISTSILMATSMCYTSSKLIDETNGKYNSWYGAPYLVVILEQF